MIRATKAATRRVNGEDPPSHRTVQPPSTGDPLRQRHAQARRYRLGDGRDAGDGRGRHRPRLVPAPIAGRRADSTDGPDPKPRRSRDVSRDRDRVTAYRRAVRGRQAMPAGTITSLRPTRDRQERPSSPAPVAA